MSLTLMFSIVSLQHLMFTDQRHVEVNFAFNLINYPQYKEITQFIPSGSRCHRRETIGVTFLVSKWSERSECKGEQADFCTFEVQKYKEVHEVQKSACSPLLSSLLFSSNHHTVDFICICYFDCY